MSARAPDTDSSAPVTVQIRRTVRAGREDEYEAWLHDLIDRAADLPGYLGTDVHRPAPGRREYLSVVRFDSIESLERFERSDLRRDALAEVEPLVEGDAVWRRLTGLEFWFSAPPGVVTPQPVRWRMAALIGLIVYVLVLTIGQLAVAVLPGVAPWLRLALVIAIEITIMTYLLLPWLTRRLARWIYPRTDDTDPQTTVAQQGAPDTQRNQR